MGCFSDIIKINSPVVSETRGVKILLIELFSAPCWGIQILTAGYFSALRLCFYINSTKPLGFSIQLPYKNLIFNYKTLISSKSQFRFCFWTQINGRKERPLYWICSPWCLSGFGLMGSWLTLNRSSLNLNYTRCLSSCRGA